MTLGFQLVMAAYFTGLAGCTMFACRDHYAAGDHVEAAVDGGFTLVLAGMAALVLSRTFP